MAFEARGTRDAGAQDDVVVAVGAGQGGVGRPEDRDDGGADSGGNVHRAAVVGDDDGAAAIEFRQLKEVGLPGQIAVALGDLFDAVPFRAGAGEHDAIAGESANEFGKVIVSPEFCFPASGRIHGNEAFGFDRCGDAEGELDGSGFAAEMARGAKAAVNGVGVGDVDDFIVEESRAFAGIRQTDAARGTGEPGHQSAAEESLEINDDVEAVFAQSACEGGKSGVLMPGKPDNFIDDRRVVEKRGESVVDEPGDVGVGKAPADEVDGRQGVDDVAERAGFDDENPHGGG